MVVVTLSMSLPLPLELMMMVLYSVDTVVIVLQLCEAGIPRLRTKMLRAASENKDVD